MELRSLFPARIVWVRPHRRQSQKPGAKSAPGAPGVPGESFLMSRSVEGERILSASLLGFSNVFR
jgi:hypothetical protein